MFREDSRAKADNCPDLWHFHCIRMLDSRCRKDCRFHSILRYMKFRIHLIRLRSRSDIRFRSRSCNHKNLHSCFLYPCKEVLNSCKVCITRRRHMLPCCLQKLHYRIIPSDLSILPSSLTNRICSCCIFRNCSFPHSNCYHTDCQEELLYRLAASRCL